MRIFRYHGQEKEIERSIERSTKRSSIEPSSIDNRSVDKPISPNSITVNEQHSLSSMQSSTTSDADTITGGDPSTVPQVLDQNNIDDKRTINPRCDIVGWTRNFQHNPLTVSHLISILKTLPMDGLIVSMEWEYDRKVRITRTASGFIICEGKQRS